MKFVSIIIPFKGYSPNMDFWEQPARANLLRDFLNSFVINYDKLTPGLLRKAIIEQLKHKLILPTFDSHWFKGSETTAQEMLTI